MNKFRFLAVAVILILLAGPAVSVSAQIGITLSDGAISGPIDGLESEIYSEMAIESFFDENTGTYLLSGEVVKTHSSGNFSGTYDPVTQQINGQYFVSLNPAYDDEGSENYALSGTFSGLLGNSGSVTLLLTGTIKYDKWNFETDDQGIPLFKDYLESTETSGDSREATFTVTGEASQAGIPGSTTEDESIPTAEPAGEACSPQPRGLDPSKPGEVISPGASYVDASGKEVGIIQERWFLNGVNTSSVIWDGQQVQVELQYTCLDHSGNSMTFTIPAYQEQSAGLPSGGISPLGIGAIIAAILGVIAAAGVGIGQVIKSGPKAPPAPAPPVNTPPSPASATPAEAAPHPAAITPAEIAPPDLPGQPVQPPADPESFEHSQSHQQRLTPEEKMRLNNIRDEMQAEIDQIKNRYRQTRDAAKKLKTFKKKNMIKFLIKKGFDVNEWILNSPVEVINKVTVDPVMEKAFGKHDASQDGNIIVQIHDRIQSLESEMQQMTDQVRYLQNEINKINQTFAERGG